MDEPKTPRSLDAAARRQSQAFASKHAKHPDKTILRLLASIDLAVHMGHISSRSLVADARLDLGEPLSIPEVQNILTSRS